MFWQVVNSIYKKKKIGSVKYENAEMEFFGKLVSKRPHALASMTSLVLTTSQSKRILTSGVARQNTFWKDGGNRSDRAIGPRTRGKLCSPIRFNPI